MDKKRSPMCSICGEEGHNKRRCPRKPIEDTTIREHVGDVGDSQGLEDLDSSTHDNCTVTPEESIYMTQKKECLIRDLLAKQEYHINDNLFKYWLGVKRPVKLKEVCYVAGEGLKNDTIRLYLELVNDINDFY
jgi:hypothetical protein